MTNEQKAGWISVSERLPDEAGWYFAAFDPEQAREYGSASVVAETFYSEHGTWSGSTLAEDDVEVTHWQPLPPPPGSTDAAISAGPPHTVGKDEKALAAERERDEIPVILFDGPTVYANLNDYELERTRPANVSDVLNAIVRALRKAKASSLPDASQGTET